jgi:hypothetical protein
MGGRNAVTGRRVDASETTLAYQVFGPLWGLAVVGAIANAAGTASLTGARFDGLVGRYVTPRRSELDRLIEAVRRVGQFTADTMEIVEAQAPWRGDGSIVAPEDVAANLVVYAGGLEMAPVDLGDAARVRYLLDMAVDLQMVNFLHGLVIAGLERNPDVDPAAELIVGALGDAAGLVGSNPATLAMVYRTWRVAFLPGLLNPDLGATPDARAEVRGYARALHQALA